MQLSHPGESTSRWRRLAGEWWIGLGILLGLLFLGMAELEFKWFAVLFVGLLAGFGAIAWSDKRKFFLITLVLAIPVIIHVNFFYHPSSLSHSTYGFQLLLVHISLAALYCLRLTRTASTKTAGPVAIPGLLPLGLFLATAFISIIFSRKPLFGFFDLFALVLSILLFLYLASQLQTLEELKLVTGLFILNGAIQGSIALAQYLTNSNLGLTFFGGLASTAQDYDSLAALSRAAGTLNHPNNLANFFDLVLPLNFSLLFYKTTLRRRLLILSAFLLGCLGLVVTLSRGGMFSVGLSLAILSMIILARTQGWLRAVVYVVTLGLLLGLVIMLTPNPIQKRFVQHDYGSAQGRLPHSQVAWNMIEANPLFGVGLNNYMDNAPFYDNTPQQIIAAWRSPVHNIYLFIMVEVGLVGFFWYVVFLLAVLRALWPAVRAGDDFIRCSGLGLLFGFGASFLHGFVDYIHLSYFSIFWASLGLSVALGRYAAAPTTPSGALHSP